MNINGKNISANDLKLLYKEFRNDHREANEQKAKPTKNFVPKRTGIVQPVNDLARFRLIIFWKNKPNIPVWIPSIDFIKGTGDKYYIDELTSYKKLVYYVTHTSHNKFITAYIMMNLENKPFWSSNKYDYCVYMNYKNIEKQRFKGEKINRLAWKPKYQGTKSCEVVDRIQFIKDNNLIRVENTN